MSRTVYFADKSVFFVEEAPCGEAFVFAPAEAGAVSRDKIVNFLETNNRVVVVTPDPDAAFARFAEDFTVVEAAGGVAVNDRGERLMIRRNGRWDLPKGHVEAGEPTEVCAVREVLEETGVETEIVAPLCATWHAYWFPKTERWELKRTHWFLLRAAGSASPTPQTEEGIEQVVWCSSEEFAAHVTGSFPTIRCVAEALLRKEE